MFVFIPTQIFRLDTFIIFIEFSFRRMLFWTKHCRRLESIWKQYDCDQTMHLLSFIVKCLHAGAIEFAHVDDGHVDVDVAK
jgi:hypothetical protein